MSDQFPSTRSLKIAMVVSLALWIAMMLRFVATREYWLTLEVGGMFALMIAAVVLAQTIGDRPRGCSS